jgi:general secretion pathway protein F
MEAFRYEALDATGRVLTGIVQADTPRQVRTQLRAQGLLPSAVDPIKTRNDVKRGWVRGISASELSLVTRQMAVLFASGLTIEQSLTALIEEAAAPRTREVLSGVKAELTGGISLAAALGSYPASFPDFYRALVHGGEESGALPTVLLHLADYLDARQALRHKTGVALLYPLLVTVVAIAIVSGLLIYVVPQIVQVFQQSRQALPLLTRSLIFLSDFLRVAWPYVALGAGSGFWIARIALKRSTVRRRWHAFLLGLPLVGPLIRSANTARFASTLAILIGGGVPLLSALASSAQVLTNQILREAIEDCIERLREGESLARALATTSVFPPLLIHLVRTGEASGTLEQMLVRAAQLETQALEGRLAVITTLVEPLMILIMGAIVLLIVLAILLPIIEINQLVR